MTSTAYVGAGPGASAVLTWKNLISSFDVCSDAHLELRVRFGAKIHGTKCCMSGISPCESYVETCPMKT